VPRSPALTVPPVLRILGVIAFVLAALALVAWFGQRHLLYFPPRSDLASDTRLARSRGSLPPARSSAGARRHPAARRWRG
jgi:hypothetical protein